MDLKKEESTILLISKSANDYHETPNVAAFANQSLRFSRGYAPDRTTEYFYFHRYNNSNPHSTIMKGTMKLIKFWKTGKNELYDLSKDLGELQDLSSQLPELSLELEDRLEHISKPISLN